MPHALLGAEIQRLAAELQNLVDSRTEDLRKSEERLRLAQSVARIGTFEWNIQTGVNVWTTELETMYGLTPGSFAGTQPAWESLVYREDRAAAQLSVTQALETGASTEGEWRVVWPDGRLRWLAARFQVFFDETGAPLRLTGVNIDITERKLAELEVRRLNDELEARVLERTTVLESTVSELRQALAEIRSLRGLLPVCAWCKKIRDDAGTWMALERYVEEHSDAEVSHGICPDCFAVHKTDA